MDFKYILRKTLPSEWHKIKILAFAKVLTSHLDKIQREYDRVTREIEFCHMWSPQVCVIEEMLRCKFKCDGIYISDPTPDPRVYIFWDEERQSCPTIYWNEEGEECPFIKWCEEYQNSCDFIVNVPSECEPYLTQIKALVEKVKLFGTQFCVEVFEQENTITGK